MLVVLSGGGTAGHINPALALAEELQSRGVSVEFAGTPQGVESRLVPQAGLPFKAFEASGFDRAHPTSMITGITKIAKSSKEAKKWFAAIHPDVVVGFGGYVSIPVARAAESMGIPVVIHEQNSVMGMANTYLAKKAAAVCLTYEYSKKALKSTDNVVITGNPVRRSVILASREEGRRMLGVPDDALLLLVFGGSLGARHLNEAIVAMKDELLSRPDLYLVHITGPKELETVEEALALTDEQRKRWIVMGYQDRMGETLAACDMIVSRAGASSLAEIAARAIPAILVPFPYATEDHQTTNAQAYVEAGCAAMIPDAEVMDETFRHSVLELIDDPAVREKMIQAAKAQKSADAAAKLADVVMAQSQGGSNPIE